MDSDRSVAGPTGKDNHSIDYVPVAVVDVPWVSDADVQMADRKWVGVRSAMGTGKTQAVAGYTAQHNVVAIAHRISLVNTMARVFSATSYRTKGAVLAPRYATTVHSLPKARQRDWSKDVVVVDEITQVMRTLACDENIKPERRPSLLATFLGVLGRAKQVFLLDADLTPAHIKLLSRLAGVPLERTGLLVNKYVPRRGHAIEYPNAESLTAKAISLASEGATIYYSASTMAEADRVAVQFRQRGFQPLVITSTTVRSPEVQAFLLNPHGFPVQILIGSPAIGTGVSLDARPDGSPLFEHVFHAGKIHELHLGDHHQQIARVRGGSRYPLVHYWMTARDGLGDPPEDAKVIADALWTELVHTGAALAQRADVHEPEAIKFDRRPYEPLLELYGAVEADRRHSVRAARDGFAARLEADGWKVERTDPRPPDADAGASSKAAREHVRAERIARIVDAPTVPGVDATAEVLDAWGKLPDHHRAAAYEAAAFRDALVLDRTPEPGTPEREALEAAVVDGGLDKVLLAESVLLDVSVAEQRDLFEFGFREGTIATRIEPHPSLPGVHVVTATEQRQVHHRACMWSPPDLNLHTRARALIHSALAAAGIAVDGLADEGVTYSRASLGTFYRWTQEHRDALYEILRVRAPKDDDKAPRVLRTILEHLGAEVTQASRSANGTRTYTAKLPRWLHDAILRRADRRAGVHRPGSASSGSDSASSGSDLATTTGGWSGSSGHRDTLPTTGRTVTWGPPDEALDDFVASFNP